MKLRNDAKQRLHYWMKDITSMYKYVYTDDSLEDIFTDFKNFRRAEVCRTAMCRDAEFSLDTQHYGHIFHRKDGFLSQKCAFITNFYVAGRRGHLIFHTA